MTIVRATVAYCDRPHCDAALTIPSNTTQPWHILTEAGWEIDYDLVPEEIATICPKHKGWLEQQRQDAP